MIWPTVTPNMFRFVFTLGVLCALLSLVEPKAYDGSTRVPMPDGRIVGGEDAEIRQYPHQISMRYNGRHRCGGSVISNNIIVSAAHCVVGLNGVSNLTIAAGSTKLSEEAQELPVREFIVHNKYRQLNNDYDAAILVLDGEFSFNENVQPIQLAVERPAVGTNVTVTGWGTTTEGGSIPDVLQQVDVLLVDNSECKNAYSVLLTSRMLCAAVDGGGKDACQGDSGGPLIYNNQLLGIVSWGTGCARANYPGVYASVPDVRDWIEETRDFYADVGSIGWV
ncbi:trypsin-7 [Scaptodrosophila lebanonensis]|uniref:trypsin n=1 Tax=Drosophila lebanonensis TaxID=7225 RepID=A0A6J2UG84_DROLE|nr:trypsin-7 [Scaptodrosophila lebanonensis]